MAREQIPLIFTNLGNDPSIRIGIISASITYSDGDGIVNSDKIDIGPGEKETLYSEARCVKRAVGYATFYCRGKILAIIPNDKCPTAPPRKCHTSIEFTFEPPA